MYLQYFINFKSTSNAEYVGIFYSKQYAFNYWRRNGKKTNQRSYSIMKTIEQLSHDTFYSMEKYSQIVIDFVQDFEDIESEEELGSMAYQIDLVLEIIDKERADDIEVLKNLQLLINESKKTINNDTKTKA